MSFFYLGTRDLAAHGGEDTDDDALFKQLIATAMQSGKRKRGRATALDAKTPLAPQQSVIEETANFLGDESPVWIFMMLSTFRADRPLAVHHILPSQIGIVSRPHSGSSLPMRIGKRHSAGGG